MKLSKSSGGILRHRKTGKFALVSQRGRSWSFPKGHIEDGETPLSTAERELQEETGVNEFTLIREVTTYSRPKLANDGTDDPSETKEITLFLFETDEDSLQPPDPHNPEARWFTAQEVEDFLTHREDKKQFQNFLESLK